MLVQVYNLKNEEKLKNLYWKVILDDNIITNEESRLITTADIYEGTPFNKTFYARTLNVPSTDFKDGFPGITNKNEWFGIIYTGVIIPPVSGKYIFNVVCDDGFELFITERLVTEDIAVPSSSKKASAGGQKTQDLVKVQLARPDGQEDHIYCEGVHPPTEYEGAIVLQGGTAYDLKIKYFQGPKYKIACLLQVEIPGQPMKLFDMNDF
jgi:hypothetical protein